MNRTNRAVNTVWSETGHFPKLIAVDIHSTRIAPPKGVTLQTSRARDLGMTTLTGKLNPLIKGISNLEGLAILNNGVIKENLDSTLARYAELDSNGIVTSSYRSPARNKAVGGKESGDHPKGLAVDAAYGNYDDTKKAIAKIIEKTKKLQTVRQLIFENVRGTERGYHIHMGFYAPGKTGPIQSLSWHTPGPDSASTTKKKEYSQKYTAFATINDLPAKEGFEYA